MTSILILAIIGVFILGGYDTTLAAPTTNDSITAQAAQYLKQENSEEALELLSKEWQKGHRTPEIAFLLGVANRQLLKYRESQKYLEDAIRQKPDFHEARLLLADTLIAIDLPSLATPHLTQLEAAGYKPSQTAMLLATAAMKQKKYAQAVDFFNRAQTDPNLAQEAKYQMGLALAADNRTSEAHKTMQESISLDPRSYIAGLGQRNVIALDRRLKDEKRFRFYGTVGFDYDTNVTLQPGSNEYAILVPGGGDWAYTQTATLEFNLLRPGPWALWAQYSYFQNFHHRLTLWDQVGHTVALTPSYTWSKFKLWVPMSFNYTDVASDKYYTGYTVTPTFLYMVDPKNGIEVAARFARKYFVTPVFLPEDNRSAHNYGASIGYYRFIKNQEGYFLARYSYETDFASGSNWDSTSHRLTLATIYPITPKLKLNPFIDCIYQPYDNEWDYGVFTRKTAVRTDGILTTGIGATYTVYKGLELNLHYYFTRALSNIPLYDYSRHIVGFQVGYRY